MRKERQTRLDTLPVQAAEHYYLVTDAIPGVDPAMIKGLYPVTAEGESLNDNDDDNIPLIRPFHHKCADVKLSASVRRAGAFSNFKKVSAKDGLSEPFEFLTPTKAKKNRSSLDSSCERRFWRA